MDGLCQSDISLMMDHVNSYKRKHLHGKTPYQAGKLLLPDDFFDLLGIEEVDPDDINLTPGLIFPGGKVPKGNISN